MLAKLVADQDHAALATNLQKKCMCTKQIWIITLLSSFQIVAGGKLYTNPNHEQGCCMLANTNKHKVQYIRLPHQYCVHTLWKYITTFSLYCLLFGMEFSFVSSWRKGPLKHRQLCIFFLCAKKLQSIFVTPGTTQWAASITPQAEWSAPCCILFCWNMAFI